MVTVMIVELKVCSDMSMACALQYCMYIEGHRRLDQAGTSFTAPGTLSNYPLLQLLHTYNADD